MEIKIRVKAYYIGIVILAVIFTVGCTLSAVKTKKELNSKPKTSNTSPKSPLVLIEPITDPSIGFPAIRREGVVKITDNCITLVDDTNELHTLVWYKDSVTYNSAQHRIIFTSPEGKQFTIQNGDSISLREGLIEKERIRFIVPPASNCPPKLWLVHEIIELID